MRPDASNLLFSYGTLRQHDVQVAVFGRELPGREDALPGWVLDTVQITDPHVIEVSGSDRHPFARRTGDSGDTVTGVVFSLTDAELAAADEYEVDDYVRVEVTLASGDVAWFYAALGNIDRSL